MSHSHLASSRWKCLRQPIARPAPARPPMGCSRSSLSLSGFDRLQLWAMISRGRPASQGVGVVASGPLTCPVRRGRNELPAGASVLAQGLRPTPGRLSATPHALVTAPHARPEPPHRLLHSPYVAPQVGP